MSYLTQWRMDLARQALTQEGATLAAVARQVGYASEYAFSAAFKREVGEAPGRWRALQTGRRDRSPSPAPAEPTPGGSPAPEITGTVAGVSTPDELTSAATTSTGVRTYDVVVIGAGPVGENVADYARKGGLSVVVVERELVGGECSYWACIPSKALLRPVHAVAAAQRVAGAAQAVTGPLDAAAVLARRDAFVHGFDDAGQVSWLDGAGIALVRGVGRLAGERRVVVDTAEGQVQLAALRAVVVCTGSAAALPPVPGLDAASPWTSREVTAMPNVPRRLAVIGGGVVSLEMAAAVKGLGAEEVTVLVRGDRVLEQVEAFAGELVVEGLRGAGVEVRFRTTAQRVERTGDGPVRLHLDDGSTLEADELLVATGRRPRTDDLGLETVGLEPGRSLPTDDGQAVHGVDGGLAVRRR
jgi:dihydrolipoamide dehydrogenase